MSVAAVLLLLGIAALWVDLPLARYCLARNTPSELRELFERGESFGHAHGVVLIALSVGFIGAARWRTALRLGGVALLAGIAADVVKIFFFRMRPSRMGPEIQTVWDSFLGFLPWLSSQDSALPFWETSYHSLPSAHTATAVALACGLASLFPRARGWFYFLALLTAANRVDGGAHFLSDTLWGAALGWCVGQGSVHFAALAPNETFESAHQPPAMGQKVRQNEPDRQNSADTATQRANERFAA